MAPLGLANATAARNGNIQRMNHVVVFAACLTIRLIRLNTGWLKFERMGQHIFLNMTYFESKACQLTFAMDIILLVLLWMSSRNA